MTYMPGEPPLPAGANNAGYVDDLYHETQGFLAEQIAIVKQDLTEPFPPACKARLERLLAIYRVAWEALRQERGRSAKSTKGAK